jgi:hypothetical protein
MSQKHAKQELSGHRMTVMELAVKKKVGRPVQNPTPEMIEKTYMMYDELQKISALVTYDTMNFCPYLSENPTQKNGFNFFSGFVQKYTPQFEVNMRVLELLLNHIAHIWCADDIISNEYILNWMAHIIQKPATKMGVAVLLKSSSQGAGKNLICEFICKRLIGNQYTTIISKSEQIFNKFNSVLENKLLTIVDEVTDCGEFHRLCDILKGFVTQTEILIERKGLENYKLPDHNNFILLSNNMLPIKIEPSDRRFFALDVSNEKANDRTYFDPLAASLTDECGLHFFHFLAQRDISNFKASDIPASKFKTELKINSLSLPIRFLFDIATRDEPADPLIDPLNPLMLRTSTRELLGAFCTWAIRRRITHSFNEISFGREISKLISTQRLMYNNQRVNGIVLSIGDLRRKCEAYIKAPIDEN